MDRMTRRAFFARLTRAAAFGSAWKLSGADLIDGALWRIQAGPEPLSMLRRAARWLWKNW